MKKTTIHCDHCGKELDTMKDFYDTEVIICCSLCDVDLCEDCYERLKYLIKRFCKKE